MLDLMKRFRTAYAKADKAGLLAATTDDFEWHQHAAGNDTELPTGLVLKGIDAVIAELAWRRDNWQDVTYEHLEERLAGDDLLVQTFIIKGIEQGRPFHAKVVDLYPVREGRIYRKDTYWKYLK